MRCGFHPFPGSDSGSNVPSYRGCLRLMLDILFSSVALRNGFDMVILRCRIGEMENIEHVVSPNCDGIGALDSGICNMGTWLNNHRLMERITVIEFVAFYLLINGIFFCYAVLYI